MRIRNLLISRDYLKSIWKNNSCKISKLFNLEARLISITQEFNQDMETIPKGWKTICLIEISKGIELITSFLDETDDWISSSRKLIMYGRGNS